FVRRARDLGFSVAEIGELLGLWNDRSRQSADVKRLARAHIAELEERIGKLREMADTLQTLSDCCAGDERPDCPILAELGQRGNGTASVRGQVLPWWQGRAAAASWARPLPEDRVHTTLTTMLERSMAASCPEGRRPSVGATARQALLAGSLASLLSTAA